jgi:hypothetical protein
MARVVIPGLPHHVTQPGNRRENVFCPTPPTGRRQGLRRPPGSDTSETIMAKTRGETLETENNRVASPIVPWTAVPISIGVKDMVDSFFNLGQFLGGYFH